MKSIYNSKINIRDMSRTSTIEPMIDKALQDPAYLAALLCTALCKSVPYDLDDPAMCDITPNFYSEKMNEATYMLEDAIMMTFYAAINNVNVKFGLPPLKDEDEDAPDGGDRAATFTNTIL